MVLDEYRQLLAGIDARSSELFGVYRQHLQCRRGCAFCCDAITVLPIEIEALRRWMRREQPHRLAPELRAAVVPASSAPSRRYVLGGEGPDGAPGAHVPSGPTQDGGPVSVDRTIDGTLPPASPAESRCALLDGDGACTVYPGRPVICRTHGLPLAYRVYEYDAKGVPLDRGGPEYMDLWCDLNFTDVSSRRAKGFFDRYGRINMDEVNNRLAALNEGFLRTSEGRGYVGVERLPLGRLLTGWTTPSHTGS
jgi:Fe-S-cluster containining protein